jgi:hypothetical protein
MSLAKTPPRSEAPPQLAIHHMVERLSTRPSLMQPRVATTTQCDQILFEILATMTPKDEVMDFQIAHEFCFSP